MSFGCFNNTIGICYGDQFELLQLVSEKLVFSVFGMDGSKCFDTSVVKEKKPVRGVSQSCIKF